MQTQDNEESAGSDDQESMFPDGPETLAANEEDDPAENLSEVAKRINILGKLVIPPSVP